METTYVFGHKKPDTDSVCASIAVAYLKNKLGESAEPRVLGTINKESKFVLDYFGMEEPQFLNDVKVKIKNMNYNKDAIVEEHTSIYDTYRMMSDFGVTGLSMVDKNKQLTGYVNIKEISKYLIDGDLKYIKTSYDNMLGALDAKQILRFDEEIEGNILAATYNSDTFLSDVTLNEDNILIVGNRYKIIDYAIKSGIKLIILVSNMQLPEDLVSIAKKKRINVISTSYDSFKCANMIQIANYTSVINVNPNPITFDTFDFRNDFIDVTTKLGHTNYPVVDNKNKCLGTIRLVDINDYKKQRVILVDHNQETQSADGIEEADIVEVIDHHNLGTIGTSSPINFRSMPVGCTCTLIYKLYQEANVEIPKNIAGIMLSAILSDTLLFKSPTTTDLDKEVGEKLAKIANIDILKYGNEMFKAASSIAGMSVEEIINMDNKTFKFKDDNLAIGQVMTMDLDEIIKKQDEFIAALNSMCSLGGYNYSVLFVTDIIKNGSYMFYNEDAEEILADAFNLKDIHQGVYLDDVVSRKKQMLPPILETLERRG